VSYFPSLTLLPPGLNTLGAGWSSAAANLASPVLSGDEAADAFGFNGSNQAARVLSVPSASGDDAAQLAARFIDSLFEGGEGVRA
jgi:hypothetical protein